MHFKNAGDFFVGKAKLPLFLLFLLDLSCIMKNSKDLGDFSWNNR